MTPRRPRHPQNQQSDYYDSDANYLSSIPPPPSTRTDAELNLRVIKRHDPSVISLVHIAPFASVYVFSVETSQWEKSGIEGSLFICQLSPTARNPERYSVFVLNRKSLDNFNAELLSLADIEITEEYIILQTAKEGEHLVYGLWIFCEPPPASTSHQRAIVSEKIQECARRSELSRHAIIGDKSNGYERGVDENKPIGVQSSFHGTNTQHDGGWDTKEVSPQPEPGRFVSSVDTDFFRHQQRNFKPHSPAVSALSDSQGRDVLLDIFHQAGRG
ncbi:hypothetical protein MMC06_001026 [Schaereria dolodes]|nr:hypothetical protein [Schaereria dolodes]